ncbi:P-type conjugative transfer protein TrbG [Brevundimonas aurantiaca]|uniref:P-type conjugative transfer protein TrbG n=1 Tax=Brevundimonas aurantiaca TaxID=74316 RepID=UPI00174CAF7A|nr:P-type conjugative transfer protein TrbG [Brevundimonas aurantiaca]
MIRLTLAGAAALALTACAGATPPPAITYDADDFQPAIIEPEPPRPVEIVETPVPLPLPGQMQPPPSVRPDSRPPTARVEAANRAATQEPSSAGYINAVQIYPWTEGALYRLYAAPERVSDIALQPGEKLISVSAGDTVRWVIGDTTSGAGDQQRVHVLTKPFAAGLTTNMVITTDRRAYHLALESTDATAMAAISWTYPQDRLIALQRQNARAETARPVAEDVGLTNLRFRYAITGDSPPWRPVRAWDDGNKVYIEFPARLDQGEAPPLFVVGPLGQVQLVNYRVSGHHYIVDRLFAAAELRLGEDPQAVVRISRTDTDRSRGADVGLHDQDRRGRP